MGFSNFNAAIIALKEFRGGKSANTFQKRPSKKAAGIKEKATRRWL